MKSDGWVFCGGCGQISWQKKPIIFVNIKKQQEKTTTAVCPGSDSTCSKSVWNILGEARLSRLYSRMKPDRDLPLCFGRSFFFLSVWEICKTDTFVKIWNMKHSPPTLMQPMDRLVAESYSESAEEALFSYYLPSSFQNVSRGALSPCSLPSVNTFCIWKAMCV